ncbi:unnamed protein product [Phaedon cochleariae]|uniref:Uncharacterized protein n=1 Tax=Phaedon cochleariae TaxID=80249 RepID=A0A9P0D9Q7_PHACE|nr:unnamed protein product [Phaedon cochleariae]
MDKFVCRTCLYVSQNITFFRTVEKVKNILELLVPEIKPNITKDSIICTQCYYFLKNIENFKQKCIDNQKMLINHNVFLHPTAHYFPMQRNHQSQYALPVQTFYDGRHEEVREREANYSQNMGTPENESISEPNVVNLSSIAADTVSVSTQQRQELKQKPDLMGIRPTTSKQIQRISVIKSSKYVEDKKKLDKCLSTNKMAKLSKHANFDSNIIEISDEEVEMNDQSRLYYSDYSEGPSMEEDDVFEEKPTITIVKNEPDAEENPSFFNKKTDEGFYDCKLCDSKYINSEGLYAHTLAEHNELKFFHCDLCNFFSLWKSALSRHESLFHAAEDTRFESKTSSLPEDLFLFCYHCAYKTKTKENLVKHIRVHFNNQTTTYTCCKCFKNFHRKDKYDLHVEGHEKGKIVCCAHCKQFYSKKYLRKHLSEAHGVLYKKYSMYENSI